MARKSSNAFTLIELLIVVGIVSILAALAVGNYASAIQRSKVARVYSDLRVLATAIETYTADHSRAPRMAHYRFYRDNGWDVIYGQRVQGVSSRSLSTPVAYLQQAFIMDPFMSPIHKASVEERLYTYQVLAIYSEKTPGSRFWPAAHQYYGEWRLGSAGPDLTFDHGFRNSAQLPYDPTNGTVSLGNLWYAQRGGIKTALPPSNLLGAH